MVAARSNRNSSTVTGMNTRLIIGSNPISGSSQLVPDLGIGTPAGLPEPVRQQDHMPIHRRFTFADTG
jgi:hypothetical protein